MEQTYVDELKLMILSRSATPVTRLFPAPFPPAQPPHFSIPLQPRSFRPPVSPVRPHLDLTSHLRQCSDARRVLVCWALVK